MPAIKTLQINHEFFKLPKKGNTKTTKKAGRTVKPIKKNTIKQELIKRIQERKQKDLDEIQQKRQQLQEQKQEQTLGGSMITSELSKSLNYLGELAKEKKKTNAPKRTGPRKNKTLKQPPSEPMVNLELPQELSMTIQPTTIPESKNIISSPPELKLTKPEIKGGTHKYNYSTTPPPYSNLKNSTGGKPSYRIWNQTRKNISSLNNTSPTQPSTQIRNENKGNNSQNLEKSERETKLERMKQLAKERENTIKSKGITTPTIIPKDITPTHTERNSTPTQHKHHIVPKKRVIKKTMKQKYTVGKNKNGGKVSVLVKNIKTRKKITEAKKELKKVNINEIKTYLKQQGFLKSGSVAPNNVLREMYESIMMTGDVQNNNSTIKLHNYVNDEN